MIRAVLTASFMAVPSLAFVQPAFAQSVEVDTATGMATAPAQPDTVVALDLAAIDTLTALGVTLDGVPQITPPAYLTEAFEGVEIVGTLFEPDFEALAVLAPDLIVAGGRSQTQVEPLSAIAPTLDMTIAVEDVVGQAERRALAYGTIFGKEAEAEALIADLDAARAEAQEAVAGKGTALILLTNGGKLSAYGRGSRFGWMHSELGLAEAHENLSVETHGEAVSFEFIAETNPDWILVIDRGAAIGQEGEAAAVTLDTPLVANTTAGQKGQIVYLDSARLYLATGGYNSLLGTMAEITEAFTKQGS